MLKQNDILLSGIDQYIIRDIIDIGGKKAFSLEKVEYNFTFKNVWNSISNQYSDPIEAIVQWYYSVRKSLRMTVVSENKRNIKTEYNQVKLAIEKDGYSLQEILAILSYALTDKFWSENGMNSLSSLRKRGKEGLMKIESIENAYVANARKNERKRWIKNNIKK